MADADSLIDWRAVNGDGTTEPTSAVTAFASLAPAAQAAGATVKERLGQIGEAFGQRTARRA